jgi:TRAP-type C4-dicarboxylate transport system permease small subunit
MRVFLDRLYLFAGMLAGAFMVAIFVLMMILSAGRPVGLNIPAADDFVSWCMAAMAFLGLAHTFRSGEMIRVGLLIDRLPERSRHWIEIVCLGHRHRLHRILCVLRLPADPRLLALSTRCRRA